MGSEITITDSERIVCPACGVGRLNFHCGDYGTGVFAPDGYQETVWEEFFQCNQCQQTFDPDDDEVAPTEEQEPMSMGEITNTDAMVDDLIMVCNLLWQQIEFMRGQRKRGWDLVFLKERKDTAIQNARLAPKVEERVN